MQGQGRGAAGVCRCCLVALARAPCPADQLRDCFNITICELDDGRPPVICEVCVRRLQAAGEFRLQVLSAQEMFLRRGEPQGSLALPIKRRELFEVWCGAGGHSAARVHATVDSVRAGYALEGFDISEAKSNIEILCKTFQKKYQSLKKGRSLKRYNDPWLDEVENLGTFTNPNEPIQHIADVDVFVDVKTELQNADEHIEERVLDDDWRQSDHDEPVSRTRSSKKTQVRRLTDEVSAGEVRPGSVGTGAEFIGEQPRKRGRPRRGEVREGKKRKRPAKPKPHPPRRRPKMERLFGALSNADTEADDDPSKMTDDTKMKINAAILLQHSTIAPFRWNVRCKCFCCNTSFVDNALLHEHAGQHTSIELQNRLHRLPPYQPIKGDVTYLKCKICEDVLKDLDSLKTHLSSVHEKKYYFDVNESIIPFKLTEEPYRCQVCYEVYHNYAPLNIHMNTHYKNYICETCGTSFRARDRYTVHLKLHLNEKEHPCSECKKIFLSEERLKFHIRHVHKKKVIEYQCPKCTERFKIYYHREIHLAEVHKVKQPEFECEFCHKKFNYKMALYTHKRRHTLEPKHECTVCGKKFFNASGLQRHMFVHDGEKHFRCDVCDKAFARKYKLQEHLRLHAVRTQCRRTDMIVNSEQISPTLVSAYQPGHATPAIYNPLQGVGLFTGAQRVSLRSSEHAIGYSENLARTPRAMYFPDCQRPDQEH